MEDDVRKSKFGGLMRCLESGVGSIHREPVSARDLPPVHRVQDNRKLPTDTSLFCENL